VSRLCWLFAFFVSSHAWASDDFVFSLPSYLSVQAGGSNQDSRNASVQAGLTVGSNWQIGLGVDGGSSPSLEEGQSLRSRGGFVSLASDPFQVLSFQGSAEAWGLEDEVNAVGGRLSAALALKYFTITAGVGGQQIRFSQLPTQLWENGTSIVKDRWVEFSGTYYATQMWSFGLSYTGHRYDKPMTDYAEGLRVLFISPAVLTTASDLNAQMAGLSVNLNLQRWNLGLRLGASRAALDGVRTRSLGLIAGFNLDRRWTFTAAATAYRPEDATEDDRTLTSSTLGVVYSW